MILYLTQGTTRLALRVKEFGAGRQLIDWRLLQLLIQPGQYDTEGCGPNGSPWILTGCWPGKRTNVDVANFRPDFPTICLNAQDLDPDGRIVFHLDKRIWCLPPGRYSGTLRVLPRGNRNFMPPFNLTHDLSREALPQQVVIPPEFLSGSKDCPMVFPSPPPPPQPEECCVLTQFDIDLGPSCADHMIDQASVEFAITHCGES